MLEVIQETLGQASYTTTRDIYAHLTDELKRSAANAMTVTSPHVV